MTIPRTTPIPADGRFPLPPALNLTGPTRPTRLLAHYLDRPLTHEGPPIHLELTNGSEPESYRLAIRPDSVHLTAPAESGLFHGVQTLRQLLALSPDGSSWPCLTLEDAPRLPWRGVMLDVARHFMPIEFLRDFIDLLALHKLNVLHLHLTDDQGWRVEIEGLPRLTEVGAWRTESMIGPAGSDRFDGVPHGGFYTQDELRGLVGFAADRGVRIVPEIEMPGHARAALAAYPELGVGGGSGHVRPLPVWTSWGICEDVFGVHGRALDFCRTVLGQVIDIFPDPFVHIGGDECPSAQWAADPYSSRRVAELGLDGPEQLHGWFLGQVRDFLAEHGRRGVSWDTAAPEPSGLPTDLVLAAWLEPAHAARSIEYGHQVLLTPHQSLFLDYAQRDHPDEPPGQPGHLVTLEDVYAFDPLALGGGGPADVAALDTLEPGVLGAQAQIWTEFLGTPADVLRVAFPRLAAFAESTWSGGRPRDDEGFRDFRARLAAHVPQLVRLGALTAERAADPADVVAGSSPADRPAKIEV
ncbi:MAG TPA: beta-N-acetylhexosaminidase [Actinospica sp.]|nr:beta-N-acetylhexosaminidase [Actinospica sp.]